jgi:hypothetical protein
MKRSMIRMAVAALFSASVLCAGVASAAPAAPLYTLASTSEMASPATFGDSFASAAAGQAMLTFSLVGFNSLDGDNGYIDVFTLSVNGAQVLSGTFNMSGGGASYMISSAPGTVWNTVTNTCVGCASPNYLGGTTYISVPISLVAGSNSLSFSYDSPSAFAGTSRAGSQGIGDESWALRDVTVAAVPEPETYAMLLAGLGLMGGIARKRKLKS